MRINARLDDETQKKWDYLAKKFRAAGQTGLIRAAIAALFDRVQKESAPACGNLLSSGFVGKSEGPNDLSETYKQELAHSLGEKHDHR